MDFSSTLDFLAKLLGIASGIWTLLFGSKAVTEIIKSRQPQLLDPQRTVSNSSQSSLPSHPRTTFGAKRSTLLNVGLAIVVLIASFIITPFLESQQSPTNVSITFPADGSKVSTLTTVQGTAHNIPKDEELWLFIVPSNQTSYFPQHGPITVLNEKWITDAHFGVESDVGLGFRLIPVLVNQNDGEAKNAIDNFFQPRGPVYHGIQRTSGMQLMLPEVTVIRE